MNIFLYTAKDTTGEEQLVSLVKKQTITGRFFVMQNFDKMAATLRRSLKCQDIVILQASSASELNNFMEIKNRLEDVRLILILPANDPDLIIKGHLLRPRFLDIVSGNDFSQINDVLAKMLSAHDSNPSSAIVCA